MGTDPTNPTVALAESRDREAVLAARMVRSQGECLPLTGHPSDPKAPLQSTRDCLREKSPRTVDIRTPIEYHHERPPILR
jgi:hypothetical protein